MCTSQIPGTLGIVRIVQEVKTKLSWLFFAEVQKRQHKGTTRQWGQREHEELHWNTTVRTNPARQCANHAGKGKIDPGSLMTPAAIHGKGTREWDVPLLCKRTGCSPLDVGEVQLHFHCSGLYLVGEEQGCDSLRAGKEWGRDGMGQGCPPASTGQTASHRRWEYPSLQQRPLWGVKDQQSPQRTVMLLTSTPKEKLLRAPNGRRVAVLKIRMTQLWSESFYFCLLAPVIWFPSYSLNHSEMCFCRQGQLCHSCFPNFKLEDIH